MRINSRAEKGRIAAGIFRSAGLKILDDLRFRKRPGQRERGAQPEFSGMDLKSSSIERAPMASSISWRSEGLLGR
jgi:hypothetical protein